MTIARPYRQNQDARINQFIISAVIIFLPYLLDQLIKISQPNDGGASATIQQETSILW